MTDTEIIKALECCGGLTDGVKECSICPLLEKSPCTTDLSRNAHALINRQKAEMDRLNKDNDALCVANEWLENMLAASRSKAIKEFAERLLLEFPSGSFSYSHIRYKANNLVKEMVGGTNPALVDKQN